MKRMAIMASGGGSNAEAIMSYFKGHAEIEVALIISNRPTAGVLDKAAAFNVPSLVITNYDLQNPENIIRKLNELKVSWIVLAGYLNMIPRELISVFEHRILNIHPSLLPKYGGKGMYGKYVHQAVFTADDQESGMTIHYVNDKYDEGKIILQARCCIRNCKDPNAIAEEVLKLEHYYYPITIEAVMLA